MNDAQIAQTILSQLGGNRFLAMTGASVTRDGPILSIRLRGPRAIRITLKPDDTYLVEDFKGGRAPSFKVTRKVLADGAYAEDLQPIFTQATGLFTSL